ncbi:LysM peptidoglycan-binding domain-containing protein, partial [Sutterella wadsworthensis]|uniref:LysM peptidoglycan-binding domain-containing protein n=1 Tax=Sutterella wadsworthensis TaxID=40545 RepID=UPI0032C13655
MKMNKILLYSASVLGLGLGFLGLSQDASAAEITVQSGDTLSKIAQTHNTTVDSLVAINGIANPNLIFVGEVLQTEGTNVATVQETQTYVEPTQTYVEPTQTYTEPVQETQTSYSSTATGSEYEAKEWIANKESGGSYTASNGQYYGRYQ